MCQFILACCLRSGKPWFVLVVAMQLVLMSGRTEYTNATADVVSDYLIEAQLHPLKKVILRMSLGSRSLNRSLPLHWTRLARMPKLGVRQ